MPELSSTSRIRDVLSLGEKGRQALWEHGYDVGDGFVDNLSQYETLDEAHRHGRLRDVQALLMELS